MDGRVTVSICGHVQLSSAQSHTYLSHLDIHVVDNHVLEGISACTDRFSLADIMKQLTEALSIRFRAQTRAEGAHRCIAVAESLTCNAQAHRWHTVCFMSSTLGMQMVVAVGGRFRLSSRPLVRASSLTHASSRFSTDRPVSMTW